MGYDEHRIRKAVIAGLKQPEEWRVEMEAINYGERLGVFYRGPKGVQRVSVDARGKTDDQIAFGLLSELLNGKPDLAEITERTCLVATVGQTKAALREEMSGITPIMRGQSPYEGKRGKHPNSCTCSKHIKAHGEQAA